MGRALLDIQKYQAWPCVMPPSPLQEVQGLSRRYLQMIVMDEQSGLLRGELQIGPGDPQVNECWLVNGKVA